MNKIPIIPPIYRVYTEKGEFTGHFTEVSNMTAIIRYYNNTSNAGSSENRDNNKLFQNIYIYIFYDKCF